MAQDRNSTFTQLDALLTSPTTLTLPLDGQQYVILSDLHMGDGGKADDFRDNEDITAVALNHYQQAGYTLILLGDIEEFWQFDLAQIENRYAGSIYNAMKAFGDRLYRVFGNHDREWGLPRDPARKGARKKTGAHEAFKLVDANGDTKLFLVHGHQGSTDSDKNSWFSRFVVRGIWKPIEPVAKWLGAYDHPSVTKSQVTGDYEQIYYQWALSQKMIIVCGHSHRAIFASKSYARLLQDQIAEKQAAIQTSRDDRPAVEALIREIDDLRQKLQREQQRGRNIDPARSGRALPCYFNTGCCLFEDGITAVEIDDGALSLVKWSRTDLQRQVYQEGQVDTFSQQLA